MLGDADGNMPGRFAVLDARDFSIAERWEREKNGLEFMYDFWYQPRQNTLVSSEWGAPNTFLDGFNPADVAAGKYGRRAALLGPRAAHAMVQTLDLGDEGWIPLELRWQHDPDSAQGFVGATLSSNIIRFHRDNGSWERGEGDRRRQRGARGLAAGGRGPGPDHRPGALARRPATCSSPTGSTATCATTTSPIRQHPVLRSQVWLGGLLGRDGGHPKAPGPLNGGPQMLQNSLDGERVYVTNSLFSTWDNQFYPEIEGLADQARPPARRQLRARPGLLRRLPRAGRRRPPARDPSARRRLHDRDLPVAHTVRALASDWSVDGPVGAAFLVVITGVATAYTRSCGSSSRRCSRAELRSGWRSSLYAGTGAGSCPRFFAPVQYRS